MRVTSARKAGFAKKHLSRKKDPPKQVLKYMKQKSSFIVASFSLIAFISGNMLGSHGWYAFWKATLGNYDDSAIIYTGTVPPVAFVPNYEKWSLYGGDAEHNTYRQVPKDLLMPLPPYDPKVEKLGYEGASAGDVYSVGHMGSYKDGAEGHGSHIGVDIRIPEGTPIRAIANGVVTRVANDAGGFGKLIVIRHPHMPDPENKDYETVLYSAYAHLSAQFVTEGEVVQKGQDIGLSGMTGFATGPHLHFQVDRDDAPWHPYWAFSYSEAREAGLSTTQAINGAFHQQRGYDYTVHPMLLVQANNPPAKFKLEPGTTIAKRTKPATVSMAVVKKPVAKQTLADARAARLQQRKGRAVVTAVPVPVPVPAPVPVEQPAIVVSMQTVASDLKAVPSIAPVLVIPAKNPIASLDFQHDRQFTGREWEKVRITLLDANGGTASESELTQDLYLRTAYGEAEFRPAKLSASHFKNGNTTIEMLPRGRRTVVIIVEPLKVLSKPMEYVEN